MMENQNEKELDNKVETENIEGMAGIRVVLLLVFGE